MNTARSGRAREHRVRDNLTSHGWVLIARSAGSKGPADLVMAHPDHGLALIQVGTPNKTLGPDDRDRILNAAFLSSALAVVATVHPGIGIRYREVTADTPSRWPAFDPTPINDGTGGLELTGEE